MKTNYLTDDSIHQFIVSALHEDVGEGDHSSLACVPAQARRKAQLLVKDEGILAGVALAYRILRHLDPEVSITPMLNDGDSIKKGDVAFVVEGNAQAILQAERLLLNCMQRMSGIATYTQKLVQLVAHTKTKILDTRKTTPNFRMMEKWAVTIGGGTNHRFGLYDMIMLKDNHIAYAGGIANAIIRTQRYLEGLGKHLRVEIETQSLAEVQEVLNIGGVQVVMLDNMSIDEMRQAVQLINGRFITEASGGITEDSIAAIAETGVDYISVGALTHSAGSLDLSLKAC
ncbi:carboxylating nicotinate-nucleotide diphosphorylase [Eisenibacter elegans]|uniref:carboxylating nicotinate-nucleotide diphosphorylase n=1 Tax=Eisenibacter elegans TaxID=997 RepID=UPI00041FFC61|nr:carboxylating nicotinate-nucleotide diphosphorylase [Eisenibacter elegans]